MAQRTMSRAVQERRAAGEVETDDAKMAKWRARDFFATPPWASRAGAELVLGLDPSARSVWEPACGDGIMAECLAEYFQDVKSSDIEPTYSEAFGAVDFLRAPMSGDQCDWVITNPPFSDAAEFVRIGLRVARRGVALLCRLAFLESCPRADLHFGSTRLSVLAPFAERVCMQLGPWNPKCSSATAYAWFVYRAEHTIEQPAIIVPIMPGTRGRLSYESDIRRFVPAAAGSLL